jgi:hypothetical protein
MMGVFQLSNRGLHPLGQMETGLIVPLIGAREATFAGGLLILLMTLTTAWRVPQIGRFRWNQGEGVREDRSSKSEPAVSSTSTMSD